MITRRMILLSACLVMMGCAGSFVGTAPQTRTVVLPLTAAPAYERALATFVQMGGQVRMADGQHVAGLLHGAVEMLIALAPAPQGTTVTVTGSVLSGKLTLGRFDEVDSYVQHLTAQEEAHAR